MLVSASGAGASVGCCYFPDRWKVAAGVEQLVGGSKYWVGGACVGRCETTAGGSAGDS